ncbi:phage portal protein [Pusillimonas sp. NJUB218]|uniref:phage portal protein n=1 Tax=Pusillimonas sp. NJUB218 TaxID=2023230 RepID=UPI000F4C2B67|nr:phage portal protein [Pusillimonas sp. NJUB218]ROT46066.1 phage portal protein [Pusillimonas sp. NJUB218]
MDKQEQTVPRTGVEVFSFGEPESVLDHGRIVEYFQALDNGRWYEPPISLDGLSRSFRSSPHHSSAIYVKRNIIASTFRPHPLLSRSSFSSFALDYLVLGNSYLELRSNRLNEPVALKHALGKYMRRSSKDLNQYIFLKDWLNEHEFQQGTIFHLMEPDINQEIYGVPEYLSALQSAWLNENATLFRRRYYKNGSHAGYIMYLTDPAHNEEDINALREAVKSSKGPGNFRNLFMYAPGGKEKGMQVIPLSEVAAKDEFFNIKNVTRDDILAAHRVPPQLMGVMPSVAGGFGSVGPVTRVFVKNELVPLQERFKELNDWIGEEVVRFNEYAIEDDTTPAPTLR